jgi:hypothetical protein
LQAFGIEWFSRAAMQTGAIGSGPTDKGPRQISVPTTEYGGDDPDLFTETPRFLIIYPFGYLVLFKNCLHKILAINFSIV